MVITDAQKRYKAATPEALRWIRDNVYAGDWEVMMVDLVRRFHARPYNHKRFRRIQADIKVMEHLMRTEVG